jgi:signal transduction histidine kinase
MAIDARFTCFTAARRTIMKEITDDDLINELKLRFDDNTKALHDLLIMTRQLEAMNEKLRRAEAYKSNFLSNIRNEINNPLSVIMGMSNRLIKGATDPESAVLGAGIIYNEAFDLDFQLRNILIAAEIEAGESSFSLSRTDIVIFISGLVESYRHKAAQKQIQLSFEVEKHDSGEHVLFVTDPEKLFCIVSNLLSNAIEYSCNGKRVNIVVKKRCGSLSVQVEDEGPGIAEQDRERIFERFVQLDTGPKRKHKGHGLGLSVAKALADMLEGKIELSRSEYGGCIFTLTLDELNGRIMPTQASENSNEYIFDETQTY